MTKGKIKSMFVMLTIGLLMLVKTVMTVIVLIVALMTEDTEKDDDAKMKKMTSGSY
jgi:hypothetical protein